ncbi:alpha/beta fold hydrolase [Hyalangium rubrum]|uniref:Alpha/beta fold hydrolase n=1 Tax=Hyalangium rubrum TaxID=3103134 RepID=A0ABU5HBV2_9BACT|nr:alpha/beta fold hydrolase [Hyalangium sp. s54d21]MDY7229555.1 alpha/beta fold hydrolase [Hyalangium sp. s54d21]
MPYAPIEEGTLYYEEYGSGPPLLLVSGLGGTSAYWRPQLEAYSKRYRVILHDHRGCGRSTRSEISYSVDQMSRDVLALMDHLRLERVHLLGHSTGGAIGQTIAVTAPERLRSLVLYASWGRTDEFFRRAMESRKALLERSGPEAFIRATPLFLFPPWWIHRFPERVAALDQVSREGFSGVAITASRCQAIIDFDRLAELGRIQAPTLVLCAQDDFLTPLYLSEELARHIPGARLVALARGAHAASQVEPEPFDQAVLGFLEEAEARYQETS